VKDIKMGNALRVKY